MIVVECSGIAEPRQIASSFESSEPVNNNDNNKDDEDSLQRTQSYIQATKKDHKDISDVESGARKQVLSRSSLIDSCLIGNSDVSVELDTLVTVVDCESFLSIFQSDVSLLVSSPKKMRIFFF